MTPAENIALAVLENYAGLWYADKLESPDAHKRRERMVADAARMIAPMIQEIEREAVESAIIGGA